MGFCFLHKNINETHQWEWEKSFHCCICVPSYHCVPRSESSRTPLLGKYCLCQCMRSQSSTGRQTSMMNSSWARSVRNESSVNDDIRMMTSTAAGFSCRRQQDDTANVLSFSSGERRLGERHSQMYVVAKGIVVQTLHRKHHSQASSVLAVGKLVTDSWPWKIIWKTTFAINQSLKAFCLPIFVTGFYARH